jgi:hypothetical protein
VGKEGHLCRGLLSLPVVPNQGLKVKALKSRGFKVRGLYIECVLTIEALNCHGQPVSILDPDEGQTCLAPLSSISRQCNPRR